MKNCEETEYIVLPEIFPLDSKSACRLGSFHFQHFEHAFGKHFSFHSYKALIEEHRADYREFNAKCQREFEIEHERKIEEAKTLNKNLQREIEEIENKRIIEMEEFGEKIIKSNRVKIRENERMEKEIDQLKKEQKEPEDDVMPDWSVAFKEVEKAVNPWKSLQQGRRT